MTEPAQRRAARTAFLLAIFLTVMGTYGVYRGAQSLAEVQLHRAESAGQASLADVAFLEAFERDPNRRALAVGNVLLSSMLLVGALLMMTRNRHALWWLRQALLANVVWIGLHLASTLHHSYRIAPELLALLDAGTGGLIRSGESRFDWLIVTLVVFASINVVAHLFMVWRLGRPDVRLFLESEDELEP